jgi:Short-chain dehydrogenases of various substrate specificities
MAQAIVPFAVVTGGSSGIGYELARQCLKNGFNVLIVADEPEIADAGERLTSEFGRTVETLEADLATSAGVDQLEAAVRGRPVAALLANAGRGLGEGFLDQDFAAVRRVIDTNVTGTIDLIQRIATDMRRRGQGRILITGSIAGFIPGIFQAVYSATKAFIDSFSLALRNELKDSGVTVTCLMPGATETEFFERANMLDTKVGQAKRADAADVAELGFEAMMRGEADIVTGWKNKMQVALSRVAPATMMAEQHRKQAQPESDHGREG